MRILLRILKGFGLALAGLIGLYLLAALAMALADPAVEAQSGPAIPGLFHVHAEASHDGFGTLDEATRAAAKAGARFLILTEHNVVRPDRPQLINGVLVVPGVEISATAGHVIALGLDEAPPKSERGPQILEAIAARGGDAIPAHPVNLRRPWADPSPEGFAGFEALSLDSAFRVAQKQKPWLLALAAPALLGDPPLAGGILMQRPAEALARYDEISRVRPVSLLCGVDAHGLPPYDVSFGALRLHLPIPWTGEPSADAAAIREAIRSGDLFCSVPVLGDAGSFSFRIEAGQAIASVEAAGVTLVLFRDGVEVARGKAPRLAIPAGAGVWRAEVLVDDPGFPLRAGALWIASSSLRQPASPEAP